MPKRKTQRFHKKLNATHKRKATERHREVYYDTDPIPSPVWRKNIRGKEKRYKTSKPPKGL